MIIALCFLFFACHHNNMEVYMSFCAVCTKYWNLVSKGVHTKVIFIEILTVLYLEMFSITESMYS